MQDALVHALALAQLGQAESGHPVHAHLDDGGVVLFIPIGIPVMQREMWRVTSDERTGDLAGDAGFVVPVIRPANDGGVYAERGVVEESAAIDDSDINPALNAGEAPQRVGHVFR